MTRHALDCSSNVPAWPLLACDCGIEDAEHERRVRESLSDVSQRMRTKLREVSPLLSAQERAKAESLMRHKLPTVPPMCGNPEFQEAVLQFRRAAGEHDFEAVWHWQRRILEIFRTYE